MDGLSVAASVIAVIQISSQILDLCRTYYINVKDARRNIERVRTEITSLQDVLTNVIDLTGDPNSSSLRTLNILNQEDGLIQQCQLELADLAAKLEPREDKSRMRQFGLRALKWPLTTQEVDKLLVTIGRHKASLTLALTTDQTKISLAIAQGIHDITHQLDSQKLDEDRETIIQWLSSTDPFTNYQVACKKCQPGTGRWLVNHTEFQEWRSTHNSLLWLHGIPGSGKTILSSIVIQELEAYCSTQPGCSLAYFYFDFNTTAKQDISHCLSSIIAQLWGQTSSLRADIKLFYERCNYGKHRAALGDLKNMLFKLIEDMDDVFIVLDALDESPKNGGREQLLATISDVMVHSCSSLHMLVTSRRESDIEETLLPILTSPALPIQGSRVDLDIKLYISWQLATDPQLRKWSGDVKAEIESGLSAGANGMFRWVDCQLDVLKRCLKLGLIREALKNLPKTLDDTYSRVLMSIEEVYRDDAKHALMWLAFSERPLQLKELAEAMIINPHADLAFNTEDRYPDPKDVLEILSSLVTVTAVEYISDFEAWYSSGEPATVTLAHLSVKEYLVSNRITRSPVLHFAVSDSISQSHIAKCCLYYLLQYATSPLKLNCRADLDAFPLLYYAARYWYIHTNLLQDEEQKLLTPLVLELLLSPCALSSWLQLHRPQAPHVQAFTKSDFKDVTTLPVLYYASHIGLVHVVQDLLDRGLDPNYREGHNETPLHGAAVRGHETVLQLLLKAGANINARTMSGLTPLYSAVREGHAEMVQMLLRHGADANMEDDRGWKPIHMAAVDGLMEIVLMLLKHGALVDATNIFDQTPFHWAAWSENTKMVDLLLQNGADINAMNGNGETALHYAASCSPWMLKHLLNRGASIDVQTLRGETPLDWAVRFKRKEAIEFLQTAGATITLPLIPGIFA